MLSIIVRTISRTFSPVMMLFGAYIIVHGHLTPGGGFPGGVLVAGAIILLVLAFGIHWLEKIEDVELAEFLEDDTLIMVLGLLVFSMLLIKLAPKINLFTGPTGTLFSSGSVFLLNIGSGIEVAIAISIIALSMLMMRRAEK